jgi:gas vesicle protein
VSAVKEGNHMKDNLQILANSENPARREFFKRFATGAVGLAAGPYAESPPYVNTELECKVSVADSLMFYFQLVTQVHGELDRAVAKPYAEALEKTESMFEQLLKEIKTLEDELRKSKMKAQARQMRDLAELGRSSTKLVRTSASRNGALLRGDTVAVVTEQVCKVAEGLLPAAEVTLSSAATDSLKRIICIIHAQDDRRQTERLSKKGLTDSLNDVQRQILVVMDSLWAGAEAAAKADVPGQNAEAMRSKAADEVGKAIATLQALKTKYGEQLNNLSSEEKTHGSLAIDMFIDILMGAKKWIADPSILPVTAQAYRDERGTFRTASWSRASARDTLWSQIGGALSNSCQADTWLRRAWCLSLIGPILVQHGDPDDRRPRIERVLDLFRCPYSGSMAGLADLLAKL